MSYLVNKLNQVIEENNQVKKGFSPPPSEIVLTADERDNAMQHLEKKDKGITGTFSKVKKP